MSVSGKRIRKRRPAPGTRPWASARPDPGGRSVEASHRAHGKASICGLEAERGHWSPIRVTSRLACPGLRNFPGFGTSRAIAWTGLSKPGQVGHCRFESGFCPFLKQCNFANVR